MNSSLLSTPYSLYLHIPFCTHRCAYCDFNTYAGQADAIPAYVDALCNEIQFVGSSLSQWERGRGEGEVHTIFFGGGTPSLLSPSQFQKIFNALRAAFDITTDAEISIEANPGTTSLPYLKELHSIGVNRLSLGVQSANPEELHMLERNHDYAAVVRAVTDARNSGFDNLNLDLIYGLPEQTLARWQHTLKLIVGLHPEHISAYALTLEHGTPFGRWAAKGLLPIPDPDVAAEQYEWAEAFLAANGYEQYEISNWALNPVSNVKGQTSFDVRPETFDSPPHFACRHNLQYWRNLNYLGLGAGAHGYANGYRYSNVLRIKTYIDRCTDSQSTNLPFPLSPATVNQHRNTIKEDMQETMMTGLRLTREGVSSADFAARFGVELNDVFGKEIEELVKLGLLKKKTSEGSKTSEILRLTPRGRLLGNQVFMRFVG